MASDLAATGAVSLGLTILNIIFIFIIGIAVLKFKEVAPFSTSTDADKEFFKTDIKVSKKVCDCITLSLCVPFYFAG